MPIKQFNSLVSCREYASDYNNSIKSLNLGRLIKTEELSGDGVKLILITHRTSCRR